MLPQNAAAREAMQEGGVIGEVHRDAIADMIVRKRNGSGLSTSFRLLIFPLMVTTELAYWPEGHFRERTWVSAEKAGSTITDREIGAVVVRFAKAAMEDDVGAGQGRYPLGI